MENVIFIDKALYFIQKARVQCQNRKTHLEKNNKNDPLVDEVLEKLVELEDFLNEKVKNIVKTHPCYDWFSKVKGIGDLNIGKVTCLIDINECSTISKLWRYALGAPINGKVEKRQKGKKTLYNQMLKTMCWRLAKSLIRANGKYADYYRQEKEKLIKRFENEGYQVVPATELPEEDGKKVEKDGKISLLHVDNMAMRKMTKLFLSHLWVKWREAEGLPITKPYAQAIKGHSHYISPEEMIEE
jgi:hypothetical protein